MATNRKGVTWGLGILAAVFAGGCDSAAVRDLQRQQVAAVLDDVHAKVASDAVKRYEIAKRSGDAVQRYAQAGIVAAAYLQAKDETQYARWLAIQKADGKAAGMPQ